MDIQTVIKAIPGVTEPQAEKLCRYYEMLMDWNSRMNLTAITGEDEVLKKHFADSLLPLELIPEGAKLIDVGTGAGFPGLPIAIARPDVKVTLLDSLNKRIGFLREVCKELDINADCIHDRAEDGGRNPALREKFDIAVSRAVARVLPPCGVHRAVREGRRQIPHVQGPPGRRGAEGGRKGAGAFMLHRRDKIIPGGVGRAQRDDPSQSRSPLPKPTRERPERRRRSRFQEKLTFQEK